MGRQVTVLTHGAPSRLPPPHKCPLCGHEQKADRASQFWECSHPECPERRPVTAQAPDVPLNLFKDH